MPPVECVERIGDARGAELGLHGVMPLLAVLADIVGIFGGVLVMSFWPLPILHTSIAISG